MMIALSGAALVQVLDETGGADCWRPLGTMLRAIPLLEALSVIAVGPIDKCPLFCPLETFTTFTVDAATAPLAVSESDLFTAARALFFVICADVPALPILSPKVSIPIRIPNFATVHALTVVREEKEKREQPAFP